MNTNRLGTVMDVPLTSNLKWALAPGNVSLSARVTGLPKDSVANVSQFVTVDQDVLTERAGRIGGDLLDAVDAGLRLALAL